MPATERYRSRERALLALVATCAVLVALAGAEIALRGYHLVKYRAQVRSLPPVAERAVVPSDDPELMFEFNPGWGDGVYFINAHGMADREVSVAKPPGVVRVAFVGDSVTANFRLYPRGVIYPTLIEQLLNETAGPGRRYQTLNFAVNGYSALQSLRVARTKVEGFDPDLLVFQICLNDPRPSPTPPYFRGDHPSGFLLLNLVLRRLGGDRFAAYEYVDRHYDEQGWENLRTAFDGFAQLRTADVPVLVVLFPYLRSSAYDEWGYHQLHQGIREAVTRTGVPFLDLYPAFSASGLMREGGDGDPIHPDPDGHRVAAAAIVAEIARLALLAPDPVR